MCGVVSVTVAVAGIAVFGTMTELCGAGLLIPQCTATGMSFGIPYTMLTSAKPVVSAFFR